MSSTSIHQARLVRPDGDTATGVAATPQHRSRDITPTLIAKGYLDAQRVGVRPQRRHCKRCGRAVIAALADDGPAVPGVRVTLDPRRVSVLGELQALSLGRMTYFVRGGLVSWRDPITLARVSAAHAHVLHTHSCAQQPIDYLDDTATKRAAAADPDHPPF